MAKTLYNLCLETLTFRFQDFSVLLQKHALTLPSMLKAELLRRLIDHDLVTVDMLPAITYNLISPAVTNFDVKGSMQLSDEIITKIALSGCNLTSLELARCPKITDNGLAEVLVNLDNLETLSLRYLIIEGTCLLRLRSNKLSMLSLVGCSNLIPTYVATCVHNHASTLEHLNLKGLRKLSSTLGCKIIAAVGARLRYLNLCECLNVDDNMLFLMAEKCVCLEVLKLRECMNIMEISLVEVLQNCVKLTKLDLSFCVRSEIGAMLKILPGSLTWFRHYGLSTDLAIPVFVSCFARLPSLTHLSLNGLNILSDELLEQLLVKVGPQITGLDISGSFDKISDFGLEAIAKHCFRLQILGLGHLTRITGEPLLNLLSNPTCSNQLLKLNLSGCTGLTDTVLNAVCSSCENLQILDLSGILHTKDDFVIGIARNCGNSLERLYLRGSRCVTDLSVCEIAVNCRYLKCISLSGISNISDKAILAFANHCLYLEEVYLSGCMVVSEAAIRYLQDKAIGRVMCYHVIPNSSGTAIIAKNLDTGEFVRMN